MFHIHFFSYIKTSKQLKTINEESLSTIEKEVSELACEKEKGINSNKMLTQKLKEENNLLIEEQKKLHINSQQHNIDILEKNFKEKNLKDGKEQLHKLNERLKKKIIEMSSFEEFSKFFEG